MQAIGTGVILWEQLRMIGKNGGGLKSRDRVVKKWRDGFQFIKKGFGELYAVEGNDGRNSRESSQERGCLIEIK